MTAAITHLKPAAHLSTKEARLREREEGREVLLGVLHIKDGLGGTS